MKYKSRITFLISFYFIIVIFKMCSVFPVQNTEFHYVIWVTRSWHFHVIRIKKLNLHQFPTVLSLPLNETYVARVKFIYLSRKFRFKYSFRAACFYKHPKLSFVYWCVRVCAWKEGKQTKRERGRKGEKGEKENIISIIFLCFSQMF